MTLAGPILYLGMPRTGSAWARSALRKFAGGIQVGPAHGRAKDVPADLRRGRLLVGSVRDPWSWYRSWYDYVRSRVRAWLPAFRDMLPSLLRPGADPVFYAAGDGPTLYSATLAHVYGEGGADADLLIDNPALRPTLERLVGRELPHPPFNDRRAELRTGWTPPDASPHDVDTIGWVAEADGPWIARFGWAAPAIPTVGSVSC